MNPDNALHDAILAMESRIQTVEFTQWNLESRAQKVKSSQVGESTVQTMESKIHAVESRQWNPDGRIQHSQAID